MSEEGIEPPARKSSPTTMSERLDAVFTVTGRDEDVPDIPELKSETVRNKRKGAMDSKTPWESIVSAAGEINHDTRRVFRYVKKKLRSKRRRGETEVKTIHIVPDDDETKWARRSASSAASRTSTDTACSSSSREEANLEVVHDLAEESIVGCD